MASAKPITTRVSLYYNNQIPAAIEQFEAFLNDGNGWVQNNISACKDFAACYTLIKEDGKALRTLFRSFEFDAPHAELCCEIGGYLLERRQYKAALQAEDMAKGVYPYRQFAKNRTSKG